MGFQELRSDFMILAEAIEFSKQFPSCHPKIFKGFVEWRSGGTGTDGYVILSDATLADESCSSQMEDYIKSHKLKVEHVKDYLIICNV
jgi:hypothetical protein